MTTDRPTPEVLAATLAEFADDAELAKLYGFREPKPYESAIDYERALVRFIHEQTPSS